MSDGAAAVGGAAIANALLRIHLGKVAAHVRAGAAAPWLDEEASTMVNRGLASVALVCKSWLRDAVPRLGSSHKMRDFVCQAVACTI